MGNVKKDKPEGYFYLRSTGDGKGIIHLQYFIDGKTVRKSTGKKIEEKYWDKKNQQLKTTCSNPEMRQTLVRYKYEMDTQKKMVDDQIFKYDGELTFEIVQQMLNGDFISKDKKKKELNFIEYCIQVQKTKLIQGGGEKTYYNKVKLIEKFHKFFKTKYGREKITLRDITPGLIDEYINWRIESTPNNKLVTTTKSLVPIVQGVESLYDDGMLDGHIYSSIKKKYLKEGRPDYTSKPVKEKVKYLTPDQIRQFLEVYKDERRKTTIQYMEMFLFSIYTGLRASDIITLEWDNIDFESRRLCKIMIKTGQILDEYLNEDSMKILEKWKNKEDRNSRFVFNLLKEDFDMNDKKKLWVTIDSKNTSIRQSLNIVGDKMGLPFKLGLHCGRHTFTVLCLDNGEDLYSVSKSLGHTSIKSTEQTYSDILDSRKRKISQERNFGFSFPI
jgi:integrase